MGEQGVVRTTISVPRELKARMDKVEESVNWSGVACSAFEAKLLELESQRQVENMDDVVARLKAAAELEDKEEYQAGLEAGRTWAKEDATPKQLRRIADYVEKSDRSYDFCWYDSSLNWNAPFGPLDHFAFVAWPDRKDDRSAADDFFEQALGDDAHRVQDDDFLHGFGDGVVEIWDQVRNKL
jgi:hypothetical protein